MNKKNELTQIDVPDKPPANAVHDHSPFQHLLDTDKFNHLWRLAQAFASSSLVPDQFQNKPANCMIVIEQALRLGCHPFAMLQNSYVVHGRPGIESKMQIALLQQSGLVRGRIQFEMSGEGDTRKCVASVVDRETGDTVAEECTYKMAIDEGWTKNPKWKNLPDLMLKYRAASFLCKLHYPDVLAGMATVEELEDSTISEETLRRPIDVMPANGSRRRQPAVADLQLPAAESQQLDDEVEDTASDVVQDGQLFKTASSAQDL